MDSAVLGLVLDSSVLIAAERREIKLHEAIENVRSVVGEIPLALCSLTVAEIAHGYVAPTSRRPAHGGARFGGGILSKFTILTRPPETQYWGSWLSAAARISNHIWSFDGIAALAEKKCTRLAA